MAFVLTDLSHIVFGGLLAGDSVLETLSNTLQTVEDVSNASPVCDRRWLLRHVVCAAFLLRIRCRLVLRRIPGLISLNSKRVHDAANLREIQSIPTLVQRLDDFLDPLLRIRVSEIHLGIMQQQNHWACNACRVMTLNGLRSLNTGVVLWKLSQQSIAEIGEAQNGNNGERKHCQRADRQ